MTFTPTNRPVPSDAPEDLYFNSSTLDALVAGPNVPVIDRTGVARKPWAAIEDEANALRDDLAAPTGADMVGVPGAAGRSQADRNAEAPNLRDYITGPVNGTASNLTDISTAVAAVNAGDKQLFVPSGIYVADGPIPNFYAQSFSGPGSFKDGGTYPCSPTILSVVNFYVATTGSDNNLGLSASRPFKTVSAALAAIPQNAVGTWIINADGSYNEALTIAKNRNPNLNIILTGPVVAAGAQTLIFDGTGLGSSAIGLYAEEAAKISVRHAHFRNFIRGGVRFMTSGLALLTNVKAVNNGTAGTDNVRVDHGQLVASGCQVDGSGASLNGFVCYHGFMSVNGASTVTGCTGAGALYAEASGGHFDTNVVSACGYGVYALQGGFPTVSGGSVSTCTIAGLAWDQGGSVTIPSAPTFSGNAVDILPVIPLGRNGKIRDDATRTVLFANGDVFDMVTASGGAFLLQLNNSGLTLTGFTWNGRRMILGPLQFWYDPATKTFRVKAGTPTSATDGTIIVTLP